MEQHHHIFDGAGQLTQNGVLLYVHAMYLDKVDALPPELIEHVLSSPAAMDEIAELYQLLDMETIQKHPHDFFRESGTVTIDWDNLDASLEAIIKAALAEQATPNKAMERKLALSFKSTSPPVEVASPGTDALCIQSIPFRFGKPLPHAAYLAINDEKGESRAQLEIAKGSASFEIAVDDAGQFPSGLYYWTLLVGDEMPISNRLYVCTRGDAQKWAAGS